MNFYLSIILIVAIFVVVDGTAIRTTGKAVSNTTISCPKTSLGIGSLSPNSQFCWYIQNNTLDFVNAEMACMNLIGGHLASIHSVFDNMKLTDVAREYASLYGNMFFIGANRLTGDDLFSYTDGSLFNFHDWSQGEPVNGQKRDCVTVDIAYGFWYAANCFDEHAYVCQTPSNTK